MVAIAEKNDVKSAADDASIMVDELIGDGAGVTGETADAGEVIDAEFTITPSVDDLQAEISRLTEQLSIRDKLELQIKGESLSVDRAASEVLRCESAVEEAKGDLKSAKERYDKRVNSLRDLVRDMAAGQGRLDFDSATPQQMQTTLVAAAAATDPAVAAPISELGKKKLKEIVGADEFDQAKNSEEPIGLTDGQLETVEGDGCQTIADLEKKLRDYPLFLTDLKGFGGAAQNRLTASLAAWRRVHPMIEVGVSAAADADADAATDAPTETPADDGVRRVIYRGDGSIVEGGVDQMVDEITQSFAAEGAGKGSGRKRGRK